jgi:hypothetical protein
MFSSVIFCLFLEDNHVLHCVLCMKLSLAIGVPHCRVQSNAFASSSTYRIRNNGLSHMSGILIHVMSLSSPMWSVLAMRLISAPDARDDSIKIQAILRTDCCRTIFWTEGADLAPVQLRPPGRPEQTGHRHFGTPGY